MFGKYFALFILLISSFFPLYAQIKAQPQWVKMMYENNASLPNVLKAYEQYYNTHTFYKNQHTQYLKRWIVQEEQVGDSQKLIHSKERKSYLQKNKKKHRLTSSKAWKGIGPFDYDEDTPNMSYSAGTAHVYTVEQSIINPTVLYAGTATAGLWKSTDKGLNWELQTRDMMISKVYSIEIDYTDENIVYMSGDNKLWKSINGGDSWSQIGVSILEDVSIADISIQPSDHNILFVCSNKGLYHSVNAGESFTQLLDGDIQEIEFNPDNSQMIYVVRENGTATEFLKSIDGGNTFIQKTVGWPIPTIDGEQKRTEIAIAPSNSNKIYALATGKEGENSGLYGVYVSTNQGESWSFQCCGTEPVGIPDTVNKNLMGWQDDGIDEGGQYYYNLALAVTSNDENKLFVGGINLWHSDDGGYEFYCPAKWSHSTKSQYVHADIHDIKIYGEDIWIATDGGIYYSNDNGASFQKRMNGIEGTDFFGFGIGFGEQGSQVMIGGTYHNATFLRDNNVYRNGWNCIAGGDNSGGNVNYSNDRIVYYKDGAKQLPNNRQQALINLPLTKKPSTSGGAGEGSKICVHPSISSILFLGNETGLWKSTDNGITFTLLKDFGENVADIEICWENPDVIYVATYPNLYARKELYRSVDGGIKWSVITLPDNLNIKEHLAYDIVASSTNENEVWMARIPRYNWTSLNTPGYKVFKSIDKGTTWENITMTGLEDELITSITHHRGSDGGIYVGTRRAIYYKNNDMNSWELYNENLPVLTSVMGVYSNYYNGKIIAATNRSVYEAPFYENVGPVADIAVEAITKECTNEPIRFSDHSTTVSTNLKREWIFEGGIPFRSSSENPIITFPLPGTYDVTLTVTDINGTDTKVLKDFITITGNCLSKLDIGIREVQEVPVEISCSENTFKPVIMVANYGLDPISFYTLKIFVNEQLIETKKISTNLLSLQTEVFTLGKLKNATSFRVEVSEPNQQNSDDNSANNVYQLNFLTGKEIPNDNMSLISYSTQDDEMGDAKQSIDGNETTYWHSRWRTGKDSLPYELIYDLGANYNITKMSFLNRQNNFNGYVKSVQLSTSKDGTVFSNPINIQLLAQKTWQHIGVSQPMGRYVKVLVTSTFENNNVASIAEIRFSECSIPVAQSITQKKQVSQPVIYPNPVFQGNEFIINTKKDEKTIVTIYDSKGILVKQVVLTDNKTISTTNMVEGIYYFQIKSETFMRYGSLLIQ